MSKTLISTINRIYMSICRQKILIKRKDAMITTGTKSYMSMYCDPTPKVREGGVRGKALSLSLCLSFLPLFCLYGEVEVCRQKILSGLGTKSGSVCVKDRVRDDRVSSPRIFYIYFYFKQKGWSETFHSAVVRGRFGHKTPKK